MHKLKIALVFSAATLACAPGFAFDLTHLATAAVLHRISYGPKVHHSKHVDSAPIDVALPAATGNFGTCRQYFFNGESPIVRTNADEHARALCFDGFAVFHSGRTKTPVFSAEVLNRQSLAAAKDESRTDVFFADARLPSAERATLEDYRGSGFDRGHTSPAGDRDNAQAMAQSFSLANMVPQSPENNRKTWAGIEKATRNYVNRASGNVYVITGPIFDPKNCPIVLNAQELLGISAPFDSATGREFIRRAQAERGYKPPHTYNLETCTIGNRVAVPSVLYKLVYDPSTNRAWAHWLANTDRARASKPISYEELTRRTGIEFLPGIHPKS